MDGYPVTATYFPDSPSRTSKLPIPRMSSLILNEYLRTIWQGKHWFVEGSFHQILKKGYGRGVQTRFGSQ